MLQSIRDSLTSISPDAVAEWWRTPLDVAVGLSTVAVAFFALVELWRAGAERRDRRSSANARVSAIAFAARRQLLSWLASPDSDHCFRWGKETEPHFPAAEERFRALMAESDASEEVKEALRGAFVHFYRATGLLSAGLVGHATPEEAQTAKSHIAMAAEFLTRVIDDKLESTQQQMEAELAKKREE